MNKFTGTLTYSDKNPAPNAKVKLTVSGSSSINESTTTDKDGNWSISLKEDVNPKDVTILFSKSGYKSKQVTNPGPTEFFEKLIDPKEGGSLELQSLFASGRWKVESLSGEDRDILDHELEDLFQFIKLKPQNVQIKIRSSESQVPNSDNEGGTRTNEFRNNPGSLAKARGESLKKYIEDEINKKIEDDDGIFNKENYRPIFNYTEDDITKIGNELWERDNPQVQAENDLLKQQEGVSKSADLSKYKKDQYVAIDVTLINKEEDCTAANLYLFVMYLTKKFGGKGGHDCNSALYQLYANDVLLKRDDGKDYASLNNDINYKSSAPQFSEAPSTYTNSQKEIYVDKLREYDNLVSRKNTKGTASNLKLPSLVALKEGDTFVPTAREYQLPPIVVTERYNTFVLDSTLLKKLTAGQPDNKKIIRFGITCYNPTGWEDPGGRWNKGCHKGAGSFKLIKVEEDKKYKGGVFTVSVATDIINGVTPRFPSSKPTWLLDYNLCETDPIKAVTFNPDLQKEDSSSNEGDTEG